MLEALIYFCYVCGEPASACPECVNTVRIDPETELPPDVMLDENRNLRNITPDSNALARSVPLPICDNCVVAGNIVRSSAGETTKLMTAAQRHRDYHKASAF
jgi:hypothetical protein